MKKAFLGFGAVAAIGTAVAAAIRTGGLDASSVFLGISAAVLAWVLWLLYRSATSLATDAVELEAKDVTGRRRKELEREKLALLKALKELEFDHEMGKVSDEDFREIGGQYRARAMRVLRQLDEAGGDYMKLVEAEIKHRVAKVSVAIAFVFFALTAVAQPMMVDPSKMSGIPRPDPQVPQGTITVRLIRGELSNRMVGSEVELHAPGGEVKRAKTDEEGRATFAGLEGGPFQARAKDGEGQEQVSQPIALAGGSGVRVMLVFAKGAPGEPDGQARVDKSIPGGTVIVRAVDGEKKPLAGLEVLLGHARSGEDQVKEIKGKTDAKGEARFDGLDSKPQSGYLAEVVKDGARFTGKPFRLMENVGSIVAIEVRPVSKDFSSLVFSDGSHFIIEVIDDAVRVVEVMRIVNSGATPVDGSTFRISMPGNSVQGQLGPQTAPAASVEGHAVVWRGPIPVGESVIQLVYAIPYKGGRLEIEKTFPIALDNLAIVTEDLPGLGIEGAGLTSETRELSGKKLRVWRGAGIAAGGRVKLDVRGLPHGDPTVRYIAAGAAVLVLFAFLISAFRGDARGTVEVRRQLEARREKLLAELVAIEQAGQAGEGKSDERRKLKSKLAEVYRELDEVAS